ncbi:hypothetical protein F5148DRAFT_985633, partial [Russula earlei]
MVPIEAPETGERRPVLATSSVQVGDVAEEISTQDLDEEKGPTGTDEHQGNIQLSQSDSLPRPDDTQGRDTHQGQEQRHIGDFDDSANPLWSLYGKETKSHDSARIQTLKEDMDGVLLFAGLFSTALTAFLSGSNRSLQVDPSQQMVYYQQQTVAMLAQVSQQLSSIAPQVSIPSTAPPPYPAFSPSSSDVRVNVYWFMSLVFSLSAALLATTVQQWVRDYMHVFQRYSHPLKSARIRQYLYDGAEEWYMPVVAEAVPGLVHISLFLFLIGLADYLLHLNTTVSITTIIPMCICASFYIFSMFAPVFNPQSPYQTSFSGLIWYVVQNV